MSVYKNKKFSWEKFNETPVVGILRGIDKETLNRIIPLYIKAGFTTIEITLNTPNALEFIGELSEKYTELNVGAGTVCSVKDLDKALLSGAQFIVTPIINIEIIKKCNLLGIPIFPGAMTPTEIYQAWEAGASAVKVFPCSRLGVGYIKDVLAPLNHIKLLPTGGVDSSNIQSFFDAGSKGVGMGGSLFPKHLLSNQESEEELFDHFIKVRSSFGTVLI